MINDLRLAVKMLVKSPAFTLVAALTLALGIGANTAIFSVIDAVLLRWLPVKEPRQLFVLNWATQKWPTGMLTNLSGDYWTDGSSRFTSTSFSYPAFQQIHDQNDVFSEVFAFADLGLNVGTEGEVKLASGQLVSGDYYSGLGVQAILGRTITAEDEKPPGGIPVAVISYRYWNRRFGLDPWILGKSINLNGIPFTIIGVTPPEFFGVQPGNSPDVSIPIHLQAQVPPRWSSGGKPFIEASDTWWVQVMGRLKPGMSEPQARTALEVLFQQVITAHQTSSIDQQQVPHIELSPGGKGLDSLRRQYSQPLFILMAMVGTVLLIACVNVASLLLTRAMTRQKEVAIRLALGSTRVRLVRQFITESLLLGMMGGTLGLLFGIWGTDLVVGLIPEGETSGLFNLHPNLRMLGFTAAISIVTAILFGLAPALKATRVDLTPALKDSRRSGGHRSHLGFGKALVVLQMSLSLLLLTGAGLFIRTLQNLKSLEVGFNPEKILLFGLDPTQIGYSEDRIARLYQELVERIESLPGVRSASFSTFGLISGAGWLTGVSIHAQSQIGENPNVSGLIVGPRFFETMEIPVLLGRSFGSQDIANSPKVAVLNQTLARLLFKGEDPLGKRIDCGSRKNIEVVGIARDAKYNSLRGEVPPTFYLPYLQNETGLMTFEVRIAVHPADIVAAVRREVQALDKNLPMLDVRTQTEQVDRSLFQERLVAKLTSFFGVLALVLTSIGLFGLLSYHVALRNQEIGIRMAVGAQQPQILWLVIRESLLLTFIGLLIGLPMTFALTRLVSSMLFGLSPTEPISILLASLLLVAVACGAGYLPARRATKIDPIVALKYE